MKPTDPVTVSDLQLILNRFSDAVAQRFREFEKKQKVNSRVSTPATPELLASLPDVSQTVAMFRRKFATVSIYVELADYSLRCMHWPLEDLVIGGTEKSPEEIDRLTDSLKPVPWRTAGARVNQS